MAENYFTQETTEWLRQKKGKFSSSEIWKLFCGGRKKEELFGKQAMTYIRSKLAEITSSEVKEEIDFKQTEWGKAHEEEAVQVFQAITGLTAIYHGLSCPKCYFMEGFESFMAGSPDGDVIEEDAGIEIKCPYNEGIHMERLLIQSVEQFKDIEWEEYCQCQSNMFIMKRKAWYFASYDPRKINPALRMKIIKMYPDSEWQEQFVLRLNAAIDILSELLHDTDKYLII